jgi:hypothetical protein
MGEESYLEEWNVFYWRLIRASDGLAHEPTTAIGLGGCEQMEWRTNRYKLTTAAGKK